MQVEYHAEAKHMVNLGYHMTCHGMACRAALGPKMTMPREDASSREMTKLGKHRPNDTAKALEAGLSVTASRACCIPASSLISQPCGVSRSTACVSTAFLYGYQQVIVGSKIVGDPSFGH